MKAQSHPTDEQIAMGRPGTKASKGGGVQAWPAICPVTELRIPECCCLRCFEEVMKPKVEALLAVGANRAGITDVAIALGYLGAAETLAEEDVREPAWSYQSGRRTRHSERRALLSRRLLRRVQASGRRAPRKSSQRC